MSALVRAVKVTATAGLVGYSTYVLQQNDWDVRSTGVFRFGRAAWAVGCISADYRFSAAPLTDNSDSTLDAWSACHYRSANRLLDLCSKNGGVFIKVGQHIAALDHLVPSEYVETLKVLHNRAPRISLADIRQVIREEHIGNDIQQLFDDFESEPLGTASLAQVHRAKLKGTNQVVAVKVQHPKVLQHSKVDMATMEILLGAVSKIFPDLDFRWLAEETRLNLPKELDFFNEGQNSEIMSDILKPFPWLKIPKIHWKLTTPRILVMDFAEGELISNRDHFIKANINTSELSNRIEQIYSQMIFINGTVHCDPHPGNILVNVKKYGEFDIILLDHGLITKLTDEFRETYSTMWMAVLNGDQQQILDCANKLGISISKHHAQLLSCMIASKPWSAVRRGLINVPDEATRGKEVNELRRNASLYFSDINKILATVDRQLLLIMKTNDLIRSISKTLHNDERRSFLTMTRACYQVQQERYLRQTNNSLLRLIIRVQSLLFFFKLNLYSIYLWFTWSKPKVTLA